MVPGMPGTGPGTAARQRKQTTRQGRGKEGKGRRREEGKERGREGAGVRRGKERACGGRGWHRIEEKRAGDRAEGGREGCGAVKIRRGNATKESHGQQWLQFVLLIAHGEG
jgi:hypothetical protein